MRVLVVCCHPDPDSFTHATCRRVCAGLTANGHDVDVLDLYAEGFDPVIDRAEWSTYIGTPAALLDGPMAGHFDRLRRAEGLVFVYPTWIWGPPAMLKGWLERVLVPGVAFSLPTEAQPGVRSLLGQIRLVAAVTSTGTPRWLMWLAGFPGRRMLLRSIRLGFSLRCARIWMALHGIESADAERRSRHLKRVERRFGRVR